ncbi:MAG: pyruvate kinase [Candidatus Magasanikbacteria bacterium]|nr:pyruvate kinase [Candidatus Magasanikbacteria bacterium]
MFRHTKIGATIGPSCDTVEILTAMVEAGLDFARLNFSHGTYETHAAAIKTLRAVEEKAGRYLAVMQDLTGPRIRLGDLPEAGLAVKDQDLITFNTSPKFAASEIPVNFAGLEQSLNPGERILIDDGRVEVTIEKISGTNIIAKVIQGGQLLPHKGLNFPDSVLNIPALQEKDLADVAFGVKHGVDTIALSFVKDAGDILALRELINKYSDGKERPIQVIAKIERHEAVRNIDSIVAAADGIMVARGDLGLELLEAEVPLIQKKIIDVAKSAGKPVIVATQLLDSMQHSRRPSRAEVSDVANAVIDHADALLLTNETAAGDFPIETIKTMAEIILLTEASEYDDTPLPKALAGGVTVDVAITELSRVLAEEVHAKCILAGSLTGETGRRISHTRPTIPVMVATEDKRTARQLNLSWGVAPFVMLPCKSIEEFVNNAADYLKQKQIVVPGDRIIIVAGEPVGQAGNVNLVEVREIK